MKQTVSSKLLFGGSMNQENELNCEKGGEHKGISNPRWAPPFSLVNEIPAVSVVYAAAFMLPSTVANWIAFPKSRGA